MLPHSATLRARAFKPGLSTSLTAEAMLSVVDSKRHGLNYAYYEGVWEKLPDFSKIKPVQTGRTYGFSLGDLPRRTDHFALRYTGFLEIEKAGDYTFYLISDDGSKLLLDGEVVIDHDGLHGRQEKSGSVTLARGRHAIEVQFFERGGSEHLQVLFEGPGPLRQDVPAHLLFQKKKDH